MSNVKAPREENMRDWQRPEWVSDMVSAIGNKPYFRWFDSGDIYTVSLAKKIAKVIELTPKTRHWLPTRAYKDAAIMPILTRIQLMDNACVRLSSDGINGETISVPGFNDSTIVPNSDKMAGVFVCRAYTRDGKCGDCRACWGKGIQTIGYVAHGQKAKKAYAV